MRHKQFWVHNCFKWKTKTAISSSFEPIISTGKRENFYVTSGLARNSVFFNPSVDVSTLSTNGQYLSSMSSRVAPGAVQLLETPELAPNAIQLGT
jgi:hypothetical protein